MSFPTGWTHQFTVTIDHTKVTGTPTGFVLLVTKDMLPASVIDAGGTSAQDGGGDLRFAMSSDGTNRLPIEVVEFHPDAISGNRRCEIWVNMAGFEPSSSVDTVVYGWCKGPTIMQQPAPSMPYGAHATWNSGGYRLINHSNDSYAPEATGLWLVRPRAVEYNGATYVTWLDYLSGGNGNIRVAKYTHSTGLWSQAVTVAAALMKDGHAAPSICVDTSGYVHVVWGAYSASGYINTAKSSSPEDISAWGSVVNVVTSAGQRTYPTMLCLSTGDLVLFSRDDDNWTRRVSTDGGATWGSAQIILLAPRAYLEWILGPSDRVHCAWHMTSSSGSVFEPKFCYLYSDNAAAATSTWKAIDGTTVSLPVTTNAPATAAQGLIYTGVGTYNTGYLRGVAVDASNNPRVSVDLYDTSTPANSRASSFAWSGSAWVKSDIVVGSGVGAGTRNHAEGGIRYLSGTTWRALVAVEVSSVLECQEYESTDGGSTWAKSADITTGSTRGSIQPQYVRGATGPVDMTLYSTAASNDTGLLYNVTNDLWFCGSHTDGIASEAVNLIAASGYQRDSSKYRNHASAAVAQAADIMPYGGYARLHTTAGAYMYDIPAGSTLRADCKDSMTVQWWLKGAANDGNEKSIYTVEGGGVTAMIQAYKTSANGQQVSFGNGSALCAVATASNSVVAGTAYRLTSQYDGAANQWVNKTKTTGTSVAGPLNYTLSAPFTVGRGVAGHLDEIRVTPTLLTANLIETEYDNQSSAATFAVGADSITSTDGALATTLSNATLSAVATLAVSGVASQTLANTTATSTGTLTLKGSAAKTLTDATVTSAGTVALKGTTTQTLADATLAATGSLQVAGSGVLAATLADASAAATGTVALKAATTQTLAAATASATGKVAIAGTSSKTLADASLAATSTLALKAATSRTLADATLSAAGVLAVTGSGTLAQTLADVAATSAGTVALKGAASITLTDAVLAGTAALALKGTASKTLDDATVSAQGTAQTVTTGTLSTTLEAAALSAAAKLAISASAAPTLADAAVIATATMTYLDLTAIVTQTLGNVTSAATGAVLIKGSAAVTLDDCAIVASNVPTVFTDTEWWLYVVAADDLSYSVGADSLSFRTGV